MKSLMAKMLLNKASRQKEEIKAAALNEAFSPWDNV